ncbi:hypothetical protein Aspvir_007870 [Aspergillus viridinutans]|uniref:Uncharacterized protein n=1 Tax=Aspergillus viridinutans TaxID=75553 RepID=A0A9P3C1U9_ASPVI|nr:uncharacterized protein Aspvir_007870 [Aspergillus viridinutans]GIK03796.1 hypothetical protein Aspvir_007870 [Aspergillus viridinutans]
MQDQLVGPRPLHIYHRSNHGGLEILDSDKQTRLYNVYRSSSKPHMAISRPAPGIPEQIIGYASFHHFKSEIEVSLTAQDISMKICGFLSSSYNVILKDMQWTWKRDGAMTSNLRLVDQRDQSLATFDNASWSIKKLGTLAIWGEPPLHVLDAIIVSGLGRIEYQRRGQKNHTGAILAQSS